MAPNLRASTLLVAFIALTSVTAQTFQYSRGWTNGKRDGHKRPDADFREAIAYLERSLTPCQLSKLKYALEGKPYNERQLFTPCDYVEDDELQSRRFKNDRQELAEAFLGN